jgi:hypothetical protein
MRKGLAFVVVGALMPVGRCGAGEIALFNGKDFSGWTYFLADKNAKFEDVWSVQRESRTELVLARRGLLGRLSLPRALRREQYVEQTVEDGIIICKGKPFGYLRTEKDYANYVLTLEWRWAPGTKGSNSGVFVHVVGEDKIWPKGVEAQLMAGRAGDFWLVGDAKLDVDKARQDPKVDRHYFRMKDDVEKPIGEWNRYEITCKGDTIKLVINGHLVNEGKNSELTKGKIILQSEGGEIHFRNIRLRTLD